MAMSLYPCCDERDQQPLLGCRANDPGCRHRRSEPLIPGQPRRPWGLGEVVWPEPQRLEKADLTTLRLSDPSEVERRQRGRHQRDRKNAGIGGPELHFANTDRKISIGDRGQIFDGCRGHG
jgi:hypothetical protein